MRDVWCGRWKIVRQGEEYLKVVEAEARKALQGQIVKFWYSKQGR